MPLGGGVGGMGVEVLRVMLGSCLETGNGKDLNTD